jgi:DNA polymerase-3 subunit epsilon
MLGLDLETTGTDVETDRIVTACAVQCGGGMGTESFGWLVNPGMEIPAEATKVHGVTNEKAATGVDPVEALESILHAFDTAEWQGWPVVAMNASFDLTLLDRECRRHLGTELALGGIRVIDPRVLDKHVDPYRRGGRKLEDLCRHYAVSLDGAHSADQDAIAACRLAWRLGTTFVQRNLLPADLGELHDRQVSWHAEQARSLAAYFRRTPGKEAWADDVRTEWPIVPFGGAS